MLQNTLTNCVFHNFQAQIPQNNPIFEGKYREIYDECFPMKTKPKKIRKFDQPWILPWREDACARKNRLYHTFVKSPTIAHKVQYTKMKIFVDKHIKLAKNKYYKKYFEQYSSSIGRAS